MDITYSPSRFHELLNLILENGKEVAPRGLKTVEIINANLLCYNPLDRIVYNPARKMNIAFSIAEWLQCMIGDDDLSFISVFNSRMKDFAFKDRIASAYGSRIVTENLNQIESCIKALVVDSFSRQAIISIFKSEDHHKWLDLPCTISLQFLLRNGKLDCIATMRSNDAIWGLTYDMFSFSMIQEYIARRLGVELGRYYHNAGSLHVYVDRDKDLINRIFEAHDNGMHEMRPMPIAPPFRSLWDMREHVRTGRWLTSDTMLNPYWQDLMNVMQSFISRKDGVELKGIVDPVLRDVSNYWRK